MKKVPLVIIFFIIVICLIQSCETFEPPALSDDQLLDGPVEGLNYEQGQRFLAGDIAFNDEIFTADNGLGSIFVATSCGSCHAGDGKGHPFTTLTRFGQTDSTGNKFLHLGGPQLQDRGLPGFKPEKIPAGATYSKFMPPANTGLGFLELVSDADLLAMSDPNDANGDGISGVPNYGVLPSYVEPFANSIPKNGKYIHRFGKKAAAYNLQHQTVNAYNQDIGITSSYSPYDVHSHQEIEPEISNVKLNNVVFYLQALKAPIQRNQQDPQVISGKNTFIQIGCEACHKETLKTAYSPIDGLSNKEFHPYSDLLLHDMGPGLDDGYTEGYALTSEWRTPPLWGLGLSPNSQGGHFYLMHDGRAASIEEAISMHSGEALSSRNKFALLTIEDKNALTKFLKSL